MIFSDSLLFCFSLLDTGAILFLLVYFTDQVITLSDLECDYLNAMECCSRLNRWVLPKLISHLILSFLLMIHGHWFLVLMNLPMANWMLYEYFSLSKGDLGVYDPTEIYNGGELKMHMRDCMIYLGYYLIAFFVYLYCLITSLLKGDPINRQFEGQIAEEF